MLVKYICKLKLLYFIGKMILYHANFLFDIIFSFYKQIIIIIIYCNIKGIEKKTTELSPIINKFIGWVEKASKV